MHKKVEIALQLLEAILVLQVEEADLAMQLQEILVYNFILFPHEGFWFSILLSKMKLEEID